jgi:hypothetical protein
MAVQLIICGLPKKQDGTFYCPYCNFESEEIEDFATSMCWDCAFPSGELEEVMQASLLEAGRNYVRTLEEDQMTYKLEDIKTDDEVTLETTFIVSRKDNWEGALYGKDLKGRKFPVTNDTGYYRNSGRHTFTVKNVKKPVKPVKVIEHMPPQLGDVWADDRGSEYHVVKGPFGGLKITDLDGNVFDTAGLKSNPGIKLIHRKGNRHS